MTGIRVHVVGSYLPEGFQWPAHCLETVAVTQQRPVTKLPGWEEGDVCPYVGQCYPRFDHAVQPVEEARVPA